MMAEPHYKCRECNRIYMGFEELVRHKKRSKHLGIIVIEN